MSALPPKADIFRGGLDVRFVPKADIQVRAAPNHNLHRAMRKRASFKWRDVEGDRLPENL